MLTVLHKDGGVERFYDVQSAAYIGVFALEPAGAMLYFDEGCCTHLDSGEIFVMNRHGATVGRYILPKENGADRKPS